MRIRRLMALAGGLMAAGAVALAAAHTGAQAQAELKLCYMSHPIQNASVAIFEKWAKAHNVRLTKTPMSYAIYLPKITQMLTSGTYEQCDLIWHNDDWGQVWEKYLVPVDDVQGLDTVARQPLDAFWNQDGKLTGVPMVHTVGTFFYRKDLIQEAELPKTLDDMVKISQKLQKDGKVKWGYVGGMSFNNSWFSLWWTMWNNNCDVFEPVYERDNKTLSQAGWKPMLAAPCHQQIVEYWWDAMKKHRISPEAMTAYGRNEANAIFMAGDALFTVADSTFWGDFNDPKKSKVAGKVGMAKFPVGPGRTAPITWIDIWAWAIPKSVAPERQKLAKEMLGAMLLDREGQLQMWRETGGPPPNTTLWAELDKSDETWRALKVAVFDNEHTHSAYYMETWPAVHKVYSDAVIQALSGPRENIPQVLKDGVGAVHDAAAGAR